MRIIFLSIILSLSAIVNAQVTQSASDLLGQGNFEAAMDEYEELIEADPENVELNYNLAVCYINTNFDKTKALPLLEKIVKFDKVENNVYYLLGRAYHYSLKFDEAIKMYLKYKKLGGGTAATMAGTNKEIEFCQNAKELLKFPVNVTFENLGNMINSPYADYYPFVPVDESFIVYNTKRDDGSELLPNGDYTSNVYYSKVKDGVFSKGSAFQNKINSQEGNQEVIGLTADGNTMLLYDENQYYNGDIFISTRSNGAFEDPIKLEDNINSKGHEIAACLTPDGNTLYFASDRKGGEGGTDLYMSKKLPIGGWGPAQNMGSEINTIYDEDFPNLAVDGKTLYFSSRGHTSMGGYDIFEAKWDGAKRAFSNVRNLGYPLNTVFDDMNLRINEQGSYGYVAAVRPEGFGDKDIYRVRFKDIDSRYTVIKGKVRANEDGKPVNDIFITVTDKKTGEIYGDYMPNLSTMRYVMILAPGEYVMEVDATGYEIIQEDIIILDKGSFIAEIEKDIVVKSR